MEIKKFTPDSHHLKCLIYGPSGVGKTFATRNLKNVLYASAEGGLLTLKDYNPEYVEIKAYSDLIDLYKFLATGNHKYETLVIDSISELADIVKKSISGDRQMQMKDWGELATKMDNMLRDFRNLKINVIFIAQETDSKDEEKIDKKLPSLYGKTATKSAYFMDIVGYYTFNADGKRVIITESDKRTLSKDRSGLIKNSINCDLQEWIDIIKNGVKVSEPKTVKEVKEEEVKSAEGVPYTSLETSVVVEKKVPVKKVIKRDIVSIGNKTLVAEVTREEATVAEIVKKTEEVRQTPPPVKDIEAIKLPEEDKGFLNNVKKYIDSISSNTELVKEFGEIALSDKISESDKPTCLKFVVDRINTDSDLVLLLDTIKKNEKIDDLDKAIYLEFVSQKLASIVETNDTKAEVKDDLVSQIEAIM